MSDDNDQVQRVKLIELVRQVIQKDDALRQTYQIGEKFRFVRDRLHALQDSLEKNLEEMHPVIQPVGHATVTDDEELVYVYLYNAKGVLLPSWQSMLNPKFFYEYGFNRPIYSKKEYAETLLRSKKDKEQHAYLAVAVKKELIVHAVENTLQDSLGTPLVKVKEGALLFHRVIGFTHNGREYTVSKSGELIRL